MTEKAPAGSKKKSESKEEAIYFAYLDMIKNRYYRVNPEDLRSSYQQRLLTREQYDSLIYDFAEKSREMATIESRTGVLNPGFLEPQFNKLKVELNRTEESHRKAQLQSIIVIFVDIDHLKKINDTYGHLAGTEAIITVAKRLKRDRRSNDSIFRVGGDEFVALLPIYNEDSKATTTTLNRIREDINENLFIDVEGLKVPLRVSMGSAIMNKGDDTTLADLLKISDKKMYEDKHKAPGGTNIPT